MQKIDKTDTLKTILSGRKYTVDYFQREYRWGQKQIEQMLTDFQSTFEEFYDPNDHDTPEEVIELWLLLYGLYHLYWRLCKKNHRRAAKIDFAHASFDLP